jgi:high-affinity iron transporter
MHQTQMLLARAERRPADPTSALLGALTIALREGLEAALLVTALLGIVRRRGQVELVRFVHGGWMLAVVLGGLTFWAASEALSGMQRELAEGIAALLAAAVLLGVTHWLFGQLTARRFMGFVAERMGSVASSPRAALGILGLSFLAAYREAFEVVLFFQALLLDAGEAQSRVWLGAALGVATLVVLTLALGRVGRRLPARPFMAASSALLALLAFMLTGKGVRALQEAGLVGIHSFDLPELPWLGIHATLQGLLAQGLVLVLLAASAAWPLLTARRAQGAEAT